MKSIFLSVILAFLVSPCFAQETINPLQLNERLIPLKSTRDDVRKILGDCKEDDSSTCLYKTEKQNIFIIYKTLEPCAGGIINVPKGTILSVTVIPLNRMLLDELKINLKDFEEEEDTEVVGIRYLKNLDEGITFSVRGKFVTAIDYTPSQANVELYRCKQK